MLAPHVPKTASEAVPWHLFQELRGLAARGVRLCIASTGEAEPPAEGVAMVRLRPPALQRNPGRELPRTLRAAAQMGRWLPRCGPLRTRRLLRWIGWQRAVVELAKRYKPDVIHSHWAFPSGSGGVAAARLLRIPAVMTLRGSDHLVRRHFSYGDCVDRFYETSLRSALQHADTVTVCCSDSLARLNELGFHDSHRLRMIHHAIDFDRFQINDAAPRQLRRRLGFGDNPVLVCVAGMHDPRKGQAILLRATAQLVTQRPALRLVLVGDGPIRGDLERLAAELGIEQHTRFVGRVHPTEVPAYLRMAHASVLPTFVDAFANVVFESLAVGTPVIASALGTPNDLLPRGPYGLLVEPGNVDALAAGLSRVLDNYGHWKHRADEGRQFVRSELSLDRRLDGFLDLYRELVPRHA